VIGSSLNLIIFGGNVFLDERHDYLAHFANVLVNRTLSFNRDSVCLSVCPYCVVGSPTSLSRAFAVGNLTEGERAKTFEFGN